MKLEIAQLKKELATAQATATTQSQRSYANVANRKTGAGANSLSAPFPQPFRIVSASSIGSFLEVLATTIDNRAGFPTLLATTMLLLSMVSRDYISA